MGVMLQARRWIYQLLGRFPRGIESALHPPHLQVLCWGPWRTWQWSTGWWWRWMATIQKSWKLRPLFRRSKICRDKTAPVYQDKCVDSCREWRPSVDLWCVWWEFRGGTDGRLSYVVTFYIWLVGLKVCVSYFGVHVWYTHTKGRPPKPTSGSTSESAHAVTLGCA